MTMSSDVSESAELRDARGSSELILIIDDEPESSSAVETLLVEAGYKTCVCRDATSAMERLRSGLRPDLIVLDLMMPGMDGWEFRTHQRSSPSWAGIPVIVVSADDSPKARAIDADAFLSKPVDLQLLLLTIRNLLSRVRHASVEAQEREIERLSSLGVLAAGLAHEVNNPLAIILGYAHVLRQGLTHPEISRSRFEFALAQMEAAAARITSVVRELGNFASSQDSSAVDPAEILDGCVRLLSNRICLRAGIQRDYAPVPSVVGPAAKLGHIFLTLLIRAVYLLEAQAQSGAVIRLAVRSESSDMVLVSISDAGPGLTPNELARVFSPVSPRVTPGGGSLNLARVKSIVEELGGAIRASSTPDGGTTFDLLFRALTSQPERPAGHAVQAPRAASAGKPRIFVIDDEASLCRLLEAMLQNDYAVTTEVDPRSALERLLPEQPYDLVLCDLMMPGLGGPELYQALSRARPELAPRFLFMTGGAFTKSASDFLAKAGEPIVKPFRLQELTARLEERLGTVGRVVAPGADP